MHHPIRAYVTGGTSGIGRAIAVRLARRGDHVWICGRQGDPFGQALAEIRAAAQSPDQRIGAVAVDVSRRESVQAAVPEILDGLGGLDLLVNNAGVACVAPITEASDDDYRRMMEVNYFGTVWTTRAFLDHLVAQRSGTVVCVASTLGQMGLYGYTAYGGSKFAVMGFCDSLRQDLLKHNIDVRVLIPADVDTPQLRANLPHKPAETCALAGKANLVTAEFVAQVLLEGLEHPHRYLIVPGASNRSILWLNRVVPGVVRWYIDRSLRRFWRHVPNARAHMSAAH